ncbi:MAG: DUF4115 domain-containing protein [Peptococcaceae bacterium]|nr:DUF4115 domain-containing protein [Peptococcaceae bacterium]
MTDIKQYEPLWGSWYVDSLIGEGSFGKVYKVRREEFGKTYYSAVKIISVPQNEADLRQMRSEGLNEASARSYFHAFVADIIQEIDLLSEFRGNSNIVSFEDHKVIERPGEIGWDILIRMELLTSLTDYTHEKPFAAKDVVKLGIHICQALELCARKNTIHRDIKPDNIFVSQFEEYKLGDFGIARQIERTMSGLSKKGTYTYMAPEVFTGQEYGANVDTYSLGIVMYRFLNQNRTPFLPAFPEPITPRDRDTALQRRMKGEALPAIPGASPAMNAIISKACAFDRKRRFASPTEMREALEKALSGESVSAASAGTAARSADPASVQSTGEAIRQMGASAAGQAGAAASPRSAAAAQTPPPPPPPTSERIAGAFGATAPGETTADKTAGTAGVFGTSASGRAFGTQTAEGEQTSRTEGVWDGASPHVSAAHHSFVLSDMRRAIILTCIVFAVFSVICVLSYSILERMDIGSSATSTSTDLLTQSPILTTQPLRTSIDMELTVLQGECWVQIKGDGNVLYEKTMRDGETAALSGMTRLEIVAGNPSVAELTLNGVYYGALGERGAVGRKIYIMEDGELKEED